MAVTVTDPNRTDWDRAESTTGWSTGSTNTTDYAEANSSITTAFDTTSGIIEHTATGTDLSSSLIYVWSANIAEQNTWKPATLSNSPHCLYISDSTNDLSLLQAGNDREVFKHADTQVVFQCFVIDTEYLSTKNTAGEIYANNGSVASFDNTSITEIGAYYTTNAKAFKGWNCGVDVIRTGAYADAVICAGGTTGDRGTWLEFVEEDRSKSANKALGVIREYTTGIYGCQGTIQLGITTASSYFEDSGFTLAWENRDVTDNAFRFYTAGYSSGTTLIAFTNGAFASAGPGVLFDASAANVSTLTFNSCTFSDLKNAVSFPTDSTSNTHEVIGCTFNNCGQIDPGTVDFEDNVITNTNTTTTGAVKLDTDGTANWSGNTFVYGGGATEAAIYIDPAVTDGTSFTLSGHTFSGYGANTTNTAAIYNNSGGEVTINATNGTTGVTYRNGAGSSTIVTNPVTTKVTVEDLTGSFVQNARVFLQTADNGGGSGLPYDSGVSTLTQTGGTATLTASAAHGLATNDYVVVRDAGDEYYNKVAQITVTSTTAFTYTVNSGASASAGGTPLFSYVAVYGLTSALGEASGSKTWPASQGLTGWVRKATTSPYYKENMLNVADASGGTDLLVALQPDD